MMRQRDEDKMIHGGGGELPPRQVNDEHINHGMRASVLRQPECGHPCLHAYARSVIVALMQIKTAWHT
jgi:hypothetical protein